MANATDQESVMQSSYGLKKLANGVDPTFKCASQDLANHG
jgi:hypothetical protein